jgi:hypothetical protein
MFLKGTGIKGLALLTGGGTFSRWSLEKGRWITGGCTLEEDIGTPASSYLSFCFLATIK